MAFLVCMPVCVSGTLCADAAGNDNNPATFFYPVNEFIAVVSLVGQNQPAAQIKRLQQSLCHTDVIAVPAGEQKAQWIPKPIRYRMDFRRQTSPAPPRFLVISPFLAPLACWWTLTVVLSSISVVSSTKSCSIRAIRIRSHTPAFVHARNRLYTLCQGPNRSGRSRHGTPVFSQYSIALSISRLLFPGRPPCAFLSGGNRDLILFHCFSLISCRFINPILSF